MQSVLRVFLGTVTGPKFGCPLLTLFWPKTKHLGPQIRDAIFRFPLSLTTFSDDSSARYLYPVRALPIYLAKTHNRRKGKKLLFVSISPKYPRDITKNTLTNYIKQAILRAYRHSSEHDMQLSSCSVHEIRSLGASVAFKYNVSMETLMQNCTWKSDLIFTNYYLRDLALQTDELYKLPGFVCAGQKLRNSKKSSHK